MPQPPQFSGSWGVSMHLFPPQREHAMHLPAEQRSPSAHAFPHMPQCRSSFCKSTHTFPGEPESGDIASIDPASLAASDASLAASDASPASTPESIGGGGGCIVVFGHFVNPG